MKIVRLIFIALSFTILVWACTKENVETKFPVKQITFCDTITFSKNIKPVIDAQCNTDGCHKAGNPGPAFTTYNDIFPHTVNFHDRLFVRLGGDMAIKGGLTPAQLQMFTCWINAGFPNN